MNCWLCNRLMTTYTSAGQVWCCNCGIVYTDGSLIHTFGIDVPYILFEGKRYLMKEWYHMLKLKSFW